MKIAAYFSLLILLLTACGCSEKEPKKEVIATIGNYSLYREDFLSELSFYPSGYRKQLTREEILDGIIQKKALLLEAQRLGLDRDQQFMKMVERFWEQSLMRSLLNKKSEEILSSIPPSDNDRNKKAAEEMRRWIEDLKNKVSVNINNDALNKIEIK